MAAAIKMDELLVNWLGSDEVYENVLEWIESSSQQLAAEVEATSDRDDAAALQEALSQYSDSSNGAGESRVVPLSNNNDNNIHGGAGAESPVAVSPKSATATIPPFFPQKGPRWGKKSTLQDSWEPISALEPLLKQQFSPPQQSDIQESSSMLDEDLILQQLPAKEASWQVFVELGQDNLLAVENFVRITKEVCHFPSFFNVPLFQRIQDVWKTAHPEYSSSDGNAFVSYDMLQHYWKEEMEPYDAPDRFFRLLKQRDSDCIVRDDFFPYVKALLQDHPGLEFLSSHEEFQSKYAVTVITRIFYSVNRGHSGRISARQVRQSDLLAAFLSMKRKTSTK